MTMDNESNIIELIDDETGATVPFEHLATIEHEGEYYIALMLIEEEDANDDEGEVVIMKIEADDEGNECYVCVEDEDLQETVFEKFLQLMEEAEQRKMEAEEREKRRRKEERDRVRREKQLAEERARQAELDRIEQERLAKEAEEARLRKEEEERQAQLKREQDQKDTEGTAAYADEIIIFLGALEQRRELRRTEEEQARKERQQWEESRKQKLAARMFGKKDT